MEPPSVSPRTIKTSSVSAEESSPFLGYEPNDTARFEKITVHAEPNRLLRFLRQLRVSPLWALFHVLFAALYSGVIVVLLHRADSCTSSPMIDVYSPASEVLQYENKFMDGAIIDNIFSSPPGPESNAAWHALLQGTVIKIPEEEMMQTGQESVALKDGSGALATLGVYHELHCIKRLRMWFYKEHYYVNLTQDEYDETWAHTVHCLEFIRQSSMCHGDLTVSPFEWLGDAQGRLKGLTMVTGTTHKCAKWNLISSWAEERIADISDYTIYTMKNVTN